VITLAHESAPAGDDYTIYDPSNTWKRKTVSNFNAVNIRKEIFRKGELVYDLPTIDEIQAYCCEQVGTLWEELLRFENPQEYYVDLSDELWELRRSLIKQYQNV
jgi:nicotinate phosphoribosyltransferase